jgi:radical SAM protein with 4Fe4S-binding SPASM domain
VGQFRVAKSIVPFDRPEVHFYASWDVGKARDFLSAARRFTADTNFQDFLKTQQPLYDATNARLQASGARLGTVTNRFCGVANDNFCVSPAGNVSACHEVADEVQPFAERFFYGSPAAGASGFEFNAQVYEGLRAHTVDRLEYCAGCFAKWSCAGDCYHKALHWNPAEFAGAGRCEIVRALTRDQILEKIAASGGVFWKGAIAGVAERHDEKRI